MPIVIHPLNRGPRPLKIVLHSHGNKIKTAEVSATYYWEHGKVLRGKDPWDAIQISQRTSGVDFISHALAAARAVESIAKIKVPANAQIIRNIMLGLEMIYGHITHFYQSVLPDFIPYPGPGRLNRTDGDYRISQQTVDIMLVHVWRSFEIRTVIHSLIALLGGKAPHVCSIVPGGISKALTGAEIVKVKSMLMVISEFINREYSHDLWQIKMAYADYFRIGGGERRLLTFGDFPQTDTGESFINPQVQNNAGTDKINSNLISVECAGSWFDPQLNSSDNSIKSRYKPVPGKAGGYSWIKGLAYDKQTYETGALARMFLSGNKIITELGNGAISVMGRYRARLEEAARLIEQLSKWVDQLDIKGRMVTDFEMPDKGEAVSFAESSAGSVIHYLSVNNGKIQEYNIFDAYCWNVCPATKEGYRNAVEQALTGLELSSGKYPIEVYRVARSF